MRRASLVFIFVTLVIDVMGFGLVIPVLPALVKGLAGPEAGTAAFGWLISAYGLMQFLFAPVLGKLSDRYGRRPILLLALLFTGLDYVLQALAPNLGWLFVGRLIAGVMGASFTTATAYIADISPPEKRAQNFGLVGAAFGLGFAIAPALGGLLGKMGDRVPFWVAAALAGLNLLYGLFVLPESLAPENRRPFVLRDTNPFTALAILRRSPLVLVLSGAALLFWLAQGVPQAVWILYTEYRFGWDELQNGLALSLLGLCSMGVQFGLIRVLQPRFGDTGLVLIGFVMNAVGFVFIGIAWSSAAMVVALMIWTVCFVGGPAIQGIVANQYGPDEQGAAQGALTSLFALSSVIGPPIWTGLFAAATRPSLTQVLPGISFFAGAVLSLIAAAVSVKALRAARAEARPALSV